MGFEVRWKVESQQQTKNDSYALKNDSPVGERRSQIVSFKTQHHTQNLHGFNRALPVHHGQTLRRVSPASTTRAGSASSRGYRRRRQYRGAFDAFKIGRPRPGRYVVTFRRRAPVKNAVGMGSLSASLIPTTLQRRSVLLYSLFSARLDKLPKRQHPAAHPKGASR